MVLIKSARSYIWEKLSSVPAWNITIILLVFSTLILKLTETIADPDLWGHLRYGLDILQQGSIPLADPYSYVTAGIPWINHEWLAEVLFALAWKSAGATGLILLKTIVVLLGMGLAFLHLCKRGILPLRAGILLLLAFFPLAASIITVRPQMFTTLLFAIILWIITKAEKHHYNWLWIAPPVMALWTNLHGGFLAGLGILGLWGLAHLIQQRKQWRKVIAPLVVSGLAVFFNPYGMNLIIFILKTATVKRPEIMEWAPIDLASGLGVCYLALLAVSVAGLIFSPKAKQRSLVFLFIVIALMPLVARRHLNLFALGALFLVGEHVISFFFKGQGGLDGKPSRPAILAMLSTIIAAVLLVSALPNLSVIRVKEYAYPNKAVALLKESDYSGNLVNHFNEGEYIIWHLGPQVKVMVDGRRETVYSSDIYQKYLQFEFGTGEWDALLKEYPAEVALVSRNRAAFNLLSLSSQWNRVYTDSDSAIFVKQDSEWLAKLQQLGENFEPPKGNVMFP